VHGIYATYAANINTDRNKADPILCLLYLIYTILAYVIACFVTDYSRWNRKSGDENEPRIEPVKPIKKI